MSGKRPGVGIAVVASAVLVLSLVIVFVAVRWWRRRWLAAKVGAPII